MIHAIPAGNMTLSIKTRSIEDKCTISITDVDGNNSTAKVHLLCNVGNPNSYYRVKVRVSNEKGELRKNNLTALTNNIVRNMTVLLQQNVMRADKLLVGVKQRHKDSYAISDPYYPNGPWDEIKTKMRTDREAELFINVYDAMPMPFKRLTKIVENKLYAMYKR